LGAARASRGASRPEVEQPTLDVSLPGSSTPAPRSRPRPPLARGLPIAAYGDDELDALAGWVVSDGQPRDAESLADELRAELGITKRGNRVDSVLATVARRALG